MPTYLRFFDDHNRPAGPRGDATAAGHEGWIELLSAQLSNARHGAHSSGAGPKSVGVQDIVVTKRQDIASAALMRGSAGDFCCGDMAVLDFVGEDGSTDLRIVLRRVLIGEMGLSDSSARAQSTPTETVTLNYGAISYDTHPGAPDVTKLALHRLQEMLSKILH